MTAQPLTQARLKALLHYDPETGVFVNRVERNGRAKKGAVAGARTQDGYICIQVEKQKHQAHRLAWLYVYGAWPQNEIDHLNRDRADNRIDNLRDVSRLVNSHNIGAHKGSISGQKGVAWHSRNRKWQVQMRVNGVHHYIGQFKDLHEAVNARLEAEKRLHRF